MITAYKSDTQIYMAMAMVYYVCKLFMDYKPIYMDYEVIKSIQKLYMDRKLYPLVN